MVVPIAAVETHNHHVAGMEMDSNLKEDCGTRLSLPDFGQVDSMILCTMKIQHCIHVLEFTVLYMYWSLLNFGGFYL